ncbi:3-oxoadipate enol-lactonase [Kaistia algarum]|uniref:3-oxoadipate enol-lactonase n=1 Tax=Kaistia algarum TaxID=2083279 RepID=UPI000CE87BB6|nr:3-oxoadipate enol-lactonase [Kaistia algarum]MCX5514408.1 3-oxoadipate enol-lactonase [Kaistia algarum]PPE79149.1 3-oxoadipate enol-lactonase [Kaistia algarum]
MLMVRAHGTCLHVKVDGPVGAPTVLLLNSLGTELRMWDGVADALAGPFRVIRFDKPGHGLSEAAERPYSIRQLAAYALSVLDAFGVERAHVVGLSIGGQIAMALADAYPRRIDRLVLSNTAARIGSPQMWSDRIGALERGGIASIADPILERWFSARWRRDHPEELAGWRAMLTRCDLAGYLGCCEALAGADLTAACTAIRQPVLVIAGSEDGATPPALVQSTAALIPQAAFVCIEGAGHLPCIEQPDAYLRLLRGFLGAPSV